MNKRVEMEVLINVHKNGQVDFNAASAGTQFARVELGDAECRRVLLTTLPRERRGQLIEQAEQTSQRIVAPGGESQDESGEDSSCHTVH